MRSRMKGRRRHRGYSRERSESHSSDTSSRDSDMEGRSHGQVGSKNRSMEPAATQEPSATGSTLLQPPADNAHPTVIPTGTPTMVWIIGHSYVFWAAKQAAVRPMGLQLGFRDVQVRWLGIRGMKWEQVFPEVLNASRATQVPVVLVIHAGGNDMVSVRRPELIARMRVDFCRFPTLFPALVPVWSEMIPRSQWPALERTRKALNRVVSHHIQTLGGGVVRHYQLEGDNRMLLRKDGVHLNDIGLDIFLSGIQDGIERALFLLGGGGGRTSL
ncbi:uncharacterized protein RB166_018585 [Leptodactylus fuscus]|uniref:uncharacterized protein LOC142183146 n=1 Tax=Leptodactylus fuscus TaxID=238119 RepID=UPI003F4EFE0D